MTPLPLSELGASLARITADGDGILIDTRGPKAAQRYAFACAGCAAELAVALRDDGGWQLRFGGGADEVREAVAEIDAAGAS